MNSAWTVKYILVMGSLLGITIGYNACSNDASFDLQQGVESIEAFNDQLSRDPSSKPTIVIDGGANFTQNAEVNLSLSPGQLADQMFISDSASCDSGSWEPLQDNKTWSLSLQNQEASVYVKYRYQDDQPTECVKDSIIHDNKPPSVQFTQGMNSLWVSEQNMNIQFIAYDAESGVKQTECDQKGSGQFQSCGQNIFYTAMEENKNYLLIVRAVDNAGNISEPKQLNWRSDQTAPVVVFNSTPAAVTADITPNFSFIGTDLGSGIGSYECRLDNSSNYSLCSNNLSLSGLSDGDHELHVRAIDNVGRVSQPISYAWSQDSSAPTIQFTQTPSAIENSGATTFSFQGINANQGIVAYRCRLDSGSYSSCNSPRSLSGLSDGSHSFSVIGQDSAGNNSAAITYTWQVDTKKPTIAFVETPKKLGNSDTAKIGLQAYDMGSGIKEMQCRLNSAAFAKCNASTTFTNLSSGTHSVEARSIDNAGNISNVISYSWTIDKSAPVVTITSGPQTSTNSQVAELQFTATDGGSGIDFIECRLDGSSFSKCVSPMNFSGLSAGQHNFSVRAKDKSGNVSNTANYQWLIDLDGPMLNFVLQPTAQVYIGNVAEVRFIGDDGNGSGVDNYQCSINGVSLSCAADTTYSYPATATESFTFQVTVTDKVGNSTTKQVQWDTVYQIVAKEASLSVSGDRPVDILFVVDNSGSMNTERSNLAQRIDGFLDKVAGLDWQLAVTSTDVKGSRDFEEGRLTAFSPGVHILDSTMDTAQAQQLFGNRVQGMPNGGNEEGIYATVKMIERALDGQGSNAINAQFLRAEADLAVVVLSDEDENSNGSSVKYTPQQFLSFVNTSFSGNKNITWHSIVTMSGDVACKNVGYSYYGVNYENLSKLTGHGEPGGAIIGSVCASDYTAQLQDIGQSVKDMQKSVSLGCSPIDADGDGTLDMEVMRKAPGASGYTNYSAPFVIQGQKLVFNDFLLVGDYKFNYNCTN